MEPNNELVRALARAIGPSRLLPAVCQSNEAAARLVLTVAFESLCPRCRSPAAVDGARTAKCESGHSFSLTRGTALHRTKVAFSHWLTAIWHLHVDKQPMSARMFAFRYGLRHPTAWALMHRVRRAFVAIAPRQRGTLAPIARRAGARPVLVAREGGELVLVDPRDVDRPGGDWSPREGTLVVGRLRAWLTEHYCGVSERYAHLYLAEYAARFRRPARAT